MLDINIDGPGIVSIKSDDIVKTEMAKRQIEVLKGLMDLGFFEVPKNSQKS